jgi:hypothetical protein
LKSSRGGNSGLSGHLKFGNSIAIRRCSANEASLDGAMLRYDLGTLGWTRSDASGTPEETLARAKAALNQR